MKLVLKEKQVEEVKTYSDTVNKPNELDNLITSKVDELKRVQISLENAQEYLRLRGREKSALKLGELAGASNVVSLADILYLSGMLKPGEYTPYEGK